MSSHSWFAKLVEGRSKCHLVFVKQIESNKLIECCKGSKSIKCFPLGKLKKYC